MSGFAQKEVQDALKARLREVAPTLSDHYVIVNDSVGSAFTVSANGTTAPCYPFPSGCCTDTLGGLGDKCRSLCDHQWHRLDWAGGD